MQDQALEAFIEVLRAEQGLDLSEYARASLKRRVLALAEATGHDTLEALTRAVQAGTVAGVTVIDALSVTASDMFRNPGVFRRLREEVLPRLAAWPRISIWQAGCARGEEVYSLAILLLEAGLYARCQIYATDFNDAALARAQEGIFPAREARAWSSAYLEAGGTGTFSDYYTAAYDHIRLDGRLRERVHFAHHNLVTDGVFCEAQLVLCRNVLIYFNRRLQNRVLLRLRDSLARGGYLCIGNRESLQFSDVADAFATVDAEHRIFRLAVPS